MWIETIMNKKKTTSQSVGVAGSVDAQEFTKEELTQEWGLSNLKPKKLTIRHKASEDKSYTVNERTYHFSKDKKSQEQQTTELESEIPIVIPQEESPLESTEPQIETSVRPDTVESKLEPESKSEQQAKPISEPKSSISISEKPISKPLEELSKQATEKSISEPLFQEEVNPRKEPSWITTPEKKRHTIENKDDVLELEVDSEIRFNLYSGMCSLIGFTLQEAKTNISNLNPGNYNIRIRMERKHEENTDKNR